MRFVIMKRKRLVGFIGVRLPILIQEAIISQADRRELAIAELAREYIAEGLRRDGVICQGKL
jgi:hypothetical protein